MWLMDGMNTVGANALGSIPEPAGECAGDDWAGLLKVLTSVNLWNLYYWAFSIS